MTDKASPLVWLDAKKKVLLIVRFSRIAFLGFSLSPVSLTSCPQLLCCFFLLLLFFLFYPFPIADKFTVWHCHSFHLFTDPIIDPHSFPLPFDSLFPCSQIASQICISVIFLLPVTVLTSSLLPPRLFTPFLRQSYTHFLCSLFLPSSPIFSLQVCPFFLLTDRSSDLHFWDLPPTFHSSHLLTVPPASHPIFSSSLFTDLSFTLPSPFFSLLFMDHLCKRKSNLNSFNSTFQLQCWNYRRKSTLPSIILRDFPSQISDPNAHFKIFGLDDFAFFLHCITSFPDSQILVFTQRFTILSKLISSAFSIQRQFKLFFRSNSASPFELQLIEISSLVPPLVFQKTIDLQYLSSFDVRLSNQKRPLHQILWSLSTHHQSNQWTQHQLLPHPYNTSFRTCTLYRLRYIWCCLPLPCEHCNSIYHY